MPSAINEYQLASISSKILHMQSRSSSFFLSSSSSHNLPSPRNSTMWNNQRPFPLFPKRTFLMSPTRHEAPRRRPNQLIDWLWMVVILHVLTLTCIAVNRFMLHRKRMSTIAVTTITITTVTTIVPTTPCVCSAPTAASVAIAAPSGVVAVGAPLVSLPFLEAMELFPVWAPWRRLNNPCVFWVLGRRGA
ncbi:hypothetical protein THAR02_02190 [Trichoderma harzianum]|uniref:Transmembrane protein n=1 Tax=Trichoderma harzianum TaxID=5544 RepID=A0A0F9XLR3_TRIHA|nr:hypothetical protein THAR02_02190 [Trichoderma harzianum]